MGEKAVLKDIPSDSVSDVVGSFVQDGKTKIECERDPGGDTWTVTATD